MLERHELDTFLALAEELHFGRAAQRIQVSPARVSQTIKKLERRVGAPLFLRTSRRVELTELGSQLAEDIRLPWSLIGVAFQRAIDTGRAVTGTVRAAFINAAGGRRLVSTAKLFQTRHPECTVEIHEAQFVTVMPWLREGLVDVALVTLPMPERGIVAGPPLVTEQRFLAVSSQHPLAAKKSVSVEDLASVPLLQLPDTLPDAMRVMRNPTATPSGLAIKPGPKAATFQEMLMLIGSGQGVFPVGASASSYYSQPGVTYVPIHDATPVQWGLVWRADNATARVHAFADCAKTLA